MPRRSISVNFLVGNYQINWSSVVIAGQQAGFDALRTEPLIDDKCSVSDIGWVNIATAAPLKNLVACEFVTANKVDLRV